MANKIWKSLLDDTDFKSEIKSNGYSKERTFINYVKSHNLSTFKRSGAATALNLSIDFYSKQSSELRKSGFFILRTGRGKFVIFDEKRFDKPYLELSTSGAEEICYGVPNDYKHLSDAFKTNLIENASIEQLHFLGVFNKIMEVMTGEKEYHIGIRGNKSSSFNVYMYDKILKQNVFIFNYHGQEDLDYSIFTKESILFFEAKNLHSNGFDIGWHKIAYPASRFKDYSKRLIPGYFLKCKKIIYFFIFPEFKFIEDGILLNDVKSMTPTRVFKINLEKC